MRPLRCDGGTNLRDILHGEDYTASNLAFAEIFVDPDSEYKSVPSTPDGEGMNSLFELLQGLASIVYLDLARGGDVDSLNSILSVTDV